MTAIRVQSLHKLYRRMAPGFQLRTLKSALLDGSLTRGLRPEETIPALEDVSFEVEKGEAFGVIGSNGSGKSTLLKILAGMVRPTAGEVVVDGRVAALIELGAGFHPEISGRENIFINGAVLGISRKQLEARYDEIVEFSGLEDFIEEPVKNYSSGMYVRLGFSVAIHTDPEVLLVDEVLSVGDEEFSHRCLRRMEEFLASGKTLLLVSHSLSLIEEYCDRAVWLDKGRSRLLGNPRRVADAYRQTVAEAEGRMHQEARDERARAVGAELGTGGEVSEGEDLEGDRPTEEVLRWGSREAEIVGARLVDSDGVERYHFASGDTVVFEIETEAASRLEDVVFGVGVFTPRAVECWGTNTALAGFSSSGLEGEATARLVCPALQLAPGEYFVDVAVHTKDGYPYDYRRKMLEFTVTSSVGGVGVYFPDHQWEFQGGIQWRRRPVDG